VHNLAFYFFFRKKFHRFFFSSVNVGVGEKKEEGTGVQRTAYCRYSLGKVLNSDSDSDSDQQRADIVGNIFDLT
jgi:hypothetical protein